MNYKIVAISSFITAVIGLATATLIINSENGYVGSMIFLPLFLLVIFAGFILFIASFIGLSLNKINLSACLLISAILLPISFLSTCLTAKYFEIGAYRQQPMIPLEIR